MDINPFFTSSKYCQSKVSTLLTRGKRRRVDADEVIPCILEPELADEAFRRSWARRIRKIFAVDPLACPKCAWPIRMSAFI